MDTSDQPVVAAAVFMVMVALTGSLCISKRRRKRSSLSSITNTNTRPQPKSTPVIVIVDDDYDPTKHISITEIAAATNNFSMDLCIGQGTFGHVYKGRIHNTSFAVAIKKLNLDYTFPGLREFRAEVEALCSFRHQNVVPLVGYCVSGGDRFLVYKFMENGSLSKWLYEDQPRPLSWKTRIKILKDVAQGLWYMHDGLKAPMIHRNIKSTNILLDKDFKARLTDFGLARTVNMGASHVSTEVNGSLGYMPPEYVEGIAFVTIKTDVYSFGVLMLEIMTGKRPPFPIMTDRGKLVRLVEWVQSMVVKNQYMEMLDPSIPREGLDAAQVEECFRIAVLCVVERSRERPTMGQVVDLLNLIPLS